MAGRLNFGSNENPKKKKTGGRIQYTPITPRQQTQIQAAKSWQKVDEEMARKPSLMERIRGAVNIDIPSIVRNTTFGSPKETVASIGEGLLDLGPKIVNTASGLGQTALNAIANPVVKKVTGQPIDKTPTAFPLPGTVAAQYYGNTSDLSNALRTATTTAGGYQFGNMAFRGASPLIRNIGGDILGGQLTSDAENVKERLNQAGLDAGFGLAFGLPGAIKGRLSKYSTPVETTAPTTALTANPATAVKTNPVVQSRTVPEILETSFPTQNRSRVGSSIQAKVEKELGTAFGDTAQYTPVTVKEQAARASDLVETNPELARQIIRGEAQLPEGLREAAFIKAVEEQGIATADAPLLQELANSKLVADTSIHAQELRLLAERIPDSPLSVMKQISNAREASLTKKFGSPIKAKTKVTAAIKKEIKALTPKITDWTDFVDSLKCT
jgi:hypothetical protein